VTANAGPLAVLAQGAALMLSAWLISRPRNRNGKAAQ